MKISEAVIKFSQAGRVGTLFGAFCHFLSSTTVWVTIGALANHLAEDFSLSPIQTGLLVATPILSGSLLRIPLGLASDRFGAKVTGTVTLALTLIPLFLLWLAATSVEALFLFSFLLGIGGASFAVALPMASRAYPSQYQGLVLGIVGAGNGGTAIATLFAPRLAERLGWHGVFGVAIVLILVTLAVFHFAAHEQARAQTGLRLRVYLAVLKESDTWRFSLFYMVTFGGFVGLASFLGYFFYDQYGVSKVMAGNLTALCVFGGSLTRPIGGLLADRYGGIRTLAVLYGVVAVAMLLLGQRLPLTWAVASLFVATAVLGMGNGAVFQLVPQRFSKEIGVVTGLVGAVGGFGGFLLPFLLGLAKQSMGSYSSGFMFLGLAAAACLALLVYVEREWRRDWAREEVGVPL